MISNEVKNSPLSEVNREHRVTCHPNRHSDQLIASYLNHLFDHQMGSNLDMLRSITDN